MRKKKFQADMILQVHDELVFDVPANELDDLKELVVEHMQNAMELEVPLVVDTGSGKDWLEAH
jgi:DNA polymerase-1